MKRRNLSLILFILITITITLVSSTHEVCSDDQIILRLYSSTNSHVSIWDVNSYTYSICYDTAFGRNFTGVNSHQCSANDSNAILWLFSSNNSHASISKIVGSYETPICFGDLECRSVNTGNAENCNPNEIVMASLLQPTNSHVSAGNNPNYPYKICCLDTNIDSAYWGDNRNNLINFSNLNDLVRLIITGSELSGKRLNFTIFKDVPWWFDTKIADISDEEFVTWRAGKDGNGDLTGGDYYFEASLEGGSEVTSTRDNPDPDYRYLTVSNTEVNDPPVARIIGPENKQIYFLGEDLNFVQDSFDVDDEFNFTWDLGDGTIIRGDSITGANYSFVYAYTGDANLGQKNIILTVTDERGLVDRDRISILVINSTYVFSYIDTPVFGETYTRVIFYNATSSYVVESTTLGDGCSKSIECIKGNCPNKTKGCPPCYAANGLTCPITVNNAPSTFAAVSYDSMNFSWSFKNWLGTEFDSKEEFGLPGVLFTEHFPVIGRYFTTLTTTLTVSSSIDVEFDIFFEADNATCIVIDDFNKDQFPGLEFGKSYWKESGGAFPMDSIDDCFRPEGIDTSGNSKAECCPFGYDCTLDGTYKCKFDPMDSCEDFKDEVGCIDDSGHEIIARNELNPIVQGEFPGGCTNFNKLYGDFCYEFLSCRCQWNVTATECQAISKHKLGHITPDNITTWDFDNLPDNIDSTCNAVVAPSTGNCIFDFIYEGSCSDGDEFIVRSWTAFYDTNDASENTPEYCVDGSDIISCEKVIRLGFFNLINLMIAILFLIVIYYFKIEKLK